MSRIWTVLGADTYAARAAIKAAGCTHAVINANWNALQPTATGILDSTGIATVIQGYADALELSLKPILSINLHYPPTWVLNTVEPFKDQLGNEYLDTNVGAGKAVRNWMWTATGRTYVSDLITRTANALGSVLVSLTDGVRIGGGWYGELHYAQAVSGGPTYAWQGFGVSMQNGTDLASDLTVCPNPGYVPYSGTDAEDSVWLNWYLNGIVTWAQWLIQQHKNAGFNRNLFLLLPGYGVRTNQTRTSSGYKQAAALGEDHIRAISAIMHDSAAWPYSTWLNTADGFPGGTVDSDKAAWKSIYEKSLIRGKHYHIIGENSGNESNSGMDTIFSDALGGSTYAGSPGIPSQGYYFEGCAWLSYTSLTDGTHADLNHYATKVAAAGS